jgi:O-antigen/teichoic acid export membrane protein
MEADTRLVGNVEGVLPARRLGPTLNLQSFWAIADQGIASLGNFLTTIILARALTPDAYGLWSVIFGLILFLNVFPASLINYPLSVRLATRDDSSSQLVKAALALTAILAAPQVLLLFTVSLLVAHCTLGICAGSCLLLWQLQEATRRALMARLVFGKALATDAISYLGQAALVWLFAQKYSASPEIAFAIIGFTCGLAGIAQLWCLNARERGDFNLREHAREFWATGRWVLGLNVVASFNLQAGPWALFLFRGPAEAAGFQAVANLLGVSHPIKLSLGNFLIPVVARVRASRGLSAARRVALTQSTQAALFLLPLILGLLVAPSTFLGLVYGGRSPYLLLVWPLRLLALSYILSYWALAIRFFLIAVESGNRTQFVFEVTWSLLFFALFIPLTLRWGLSGAIVATGISQGARLITNLMLMRQIKVPEQLSTTTE